MAKIPPQNEISMKRIEEFENGRKIKDIVKITHTSYTKYIDNSAYETSFEIPTEDLGYLLDTVQDCWDEYKNNEKEK